MPFAHGIALPNTFRPVFAVLNPLVFEHCFTAWMSTLCPSLAGCHVDNDGKTVRGSHSDEWMPLHLVSAWCSANGLTLGQVATEQKSNEITAIPALLQALQPQGATVAIDAMGTQHDIAETIVAGGADYVLAVKDNQPTLADAMRDWFAAAQAGRLEHSYWEHVEHDKGHGRLETRVCRVTEDVAWLKRLGQECAGIQRLVMVESHRTVKGHTSAEYRYFISSRACKAQEMAGLIRRMGHREWFAPRARHVPGRGCPPDTRPDSRAQPGPAAQDHAEPGAAGPATRRQAPQLEERAQPGGLECRLPQPVARPCLIRVFM